MEEIIVIRNEIGVEVFNNGAKLIVLFKDKPILKTLNEQEILDLYLSESL